VTATVLHVEDNSSNRMIIRDLLRSRGYTIVEVMDGAEAVVAAERERPNIILMDIQLPSISGLEAARRIKAKVELRHIPIVALTSFALSGDDKKAFAAGCDAYLAKPYKPRELLKLIEEFLAKQP